MSDYCKGCEYQVKTATDEDSCPFNSLYWNFIHRHKDTFAKNQRMSMIYRNFERMDSNKRDAIIARSNHLLEHLNEL
jgi:deoxyribodipyrimidine photolyase-related protein